MLELVKYEGKSKEDLLKKIKQELGEDILIEEEEKETTLFKSKKYIIFAQNKENIKDEILKFISQIEKIAKLNLKANIKIEENIFKIDLDSDKNSLLIGKDGRTLDAIQTLLKTVFAYLPIKIQVDISNYKENKLKIFEKEIKNIALEVANTKVDVTLEPMNSYKRRQVHMIIKEFSNLSSESVGEEPERRIKINYED